MELRGKTALVTGAAKRIGRQIALALAHRGTTILLHYSHSSDEALKTKTEIEALGSKCFLFQYSFDSSDHVKRMILEISAKHSVDILVNSASSFYETPLASATEKDFDHFVQVNLKTPFLLCQAFGLKMAAGNGGSIINIVDWSAMRPYRDYAPYCLSKGGLLTFTKSLAQDLAPKVRANAIAPGPILPPSNFPKAEIEAIAKKTVLQHWGSPQDIANAVTFLAENDFINGIVLTVDGGRSLI